MKKEYFVIAPIILLYTIVFQALVVSAQVAPGLESLENDSLLGTVQTGTEKAGEFQATENKSDFLKAQWGELLSRNTMIGPIIRFFDKISPVTNPIFKYTIGLEPSLTWLFILTLTIWITLVIIILRLMALTSPFSKWVQYVMSFVFIIFISIVGVTRAIAEWIINIISALSTWYMQLIAIVLFIIVLIISAIFSKNLKKLGKKEAKKMEEEKLKSEVETLKGKVEVQEAVMKAETGEV